MKQGSEAVYCEPERADVHLVGECTKGGDLAFQAGSPETKCSSESATLGGSGADDSTHTVNPKKDVSCESFPRQVFFRRASRAPCDNSQME